MSLWEPGFDDFAGGESLVNEFVEFGAPENQELTGELGSLMSGTGDDGCDFDLCWHYSSSDDELWVTLVNPGEENSEKNHQKDDIFGCDHEISSCTIVVVDDDGDTNYNINNINCSDFVDDHHVFDQGNGVSVSVSVPPLDTVSASAVSAYELGNIPSSSSRNQSSQAADDDDGVTDHDLAHSSAAAAYDEYYLQGFQKEPTFDHHGTAGNYGNMFPVGYRFCPSDPELVVHYLAKKVSGQQFFGHPIPDVDFYAENPAQLTCRYPRAEYANDDEWYFFTKREKKYLPPTKKVKKYRKNSNGKQPSRVTRDGLGFWKTIFGNKDVKDRQDSMVGYKRVLDYYFYVPIPGSEPKEHAKGEEIRSEWKMIEYTMTKDTDAVTDSTSTTLDTWVLCKLYLNSRKRKREDQED